MGQRQSSSRRKGVAANAAIRTAAASARAGEVSTPGAALAAFGIDLLAHVTPPNATKNVFISPFSVFQSLAMVGVGATQPGDGKASNVSAEFRTVLGVDVNDEAVRASMRAMREQLTAPDGPVTMLDANSVGSFLF